MKRKIKGQEEIVGFALIIIIVAVILLVILGLSLGGKGKEAVQSYEVGSFIQTTLQYTSDCYNGIEYLPILKLIFECENENSCDDERNTCDVLNSTLREISEKSWKVGEQAPIKGYKIRIVTEEREVLLIKQGNETKSYKSSMQSFSRQGIDYDMSFSVYY
ncbi:MAG: hypothetical protein Q7S06_01995 [Nanoarchaeota archaeon]|nr:hypothetical protein [Nanoarchaeota archaeon]